MGDDDAPLEWGPTPRDPGHLVASIILTIALTIITVLLVAAGGSAWQ